MRPPKLPRTLAVAALAVAAAMVAAPAQAATRTPQAEVQRQVDRVLAGHPDARQSAPGTVTFAGGAILEIPEAGTMATACTAGWYCFYADNDFGGRKLSFHDCGLTQYLTNYGFGNQTSSWRNTSVNTVYADDNNTQPPTQMWTEEPKSEAAAVGATFDNRADSFYTACG
ncbi:hypothetical protein [Actinomadura luteofluorescens]|uniref:hypothetical protein n=1 Tax=Actinomadura luteofluorescens TaxID=46163 RepID=UPI003D91F5FF